jgi:hypothetical protein
VDIEPAATLRCWSIDVDLGGQTYTIPPLPASTWMVALVAGTWFDIVPGLLADAGDLDDELLDGAVTYDELRAAGRAALAAAAGTKWWSAANLANVTAQTWISGELLLRGVDPDRVSLAAYLSAAYRVAARNLDKNQWARFQMDMDKPPIGLPPEEWFDEDEAAASFEALMAADAG